MGSIGCGQTAHAKFLPTAPTGWSLCYPSACSVQITWPHVPESRSGLPALCLVLPRPAGAQAGFDFSLMVARRCQTESPDAVASPCRSCPH